MPLMGEGVLEATLVRWLKKVGDDVKKDEPLFEVSTDKVDTEIPAPASGKLNALLVNEGDKVKVNQVMALIGGDSKDISTQEKETPVTPEISKPTEQPIIEKTKNREKPQIETSGFRSSPLVRKIAESHGLDLEKIPGSGLLGRINKYDVLKVLNDQVPSPSQVFAKKQEKSSEKKNYNTEIKDGLEYLEGVPVKRTPMTKMRKLIAEHMVESVRTSPHVTTVFEIDVAKIFLIREKYKNDFQKKEGFNLTYTPFFIHAAVKAIQQFPLVNCSVDGEDLLLKDPINIGCATAIETGLIVPVIKNAQDLNLAGIARKLNDLVTRARSKKLQPDDVKGGTFSITNTKI